MALKKDGSLWSWGQVPGVPGIVTTPIQIGHVTDWASIRISTHTMALKKDGSLWAWGNNENGQLGVSTSPSYPIRKEPTRVGTDSDWAQISIGNSYSLALKTDGSLWAWGLNGGWLGDGTRTTRWVPTRIGTDTDWKSISVGQSHVVALKTDGSLWAWGKNEYGQLGDGTTTTRLVPTRIGTDNNWKMASAGAYHTLALRQDGKLWGWGQNFFYQLSYGPKPEYSVEPLLLYQPTQPMRANDEMTLWPNPATATDLVRLRTAATQPATLRLLSPLGRLVREMPVPAGSQQITVPTNGLGRGLYWVQLVQPAGRATQPLLLR
jgi:alpha-tubulin suppressor-like RCC1 family protein